MKELTAEEKSQFDQKLQEFQQKYPQIKLSEARRIFFGSWSIDYYESRLKLLLDYEKEALEYPEKLIQSKTSITIGLGEKELKGILKAWNALDFQIEIEGGILATLKKLECRYFFKTEEEEKFRQGVRLEKMKYPFEKRSEFKWVGDDFLLKFNLQHKEPIVLKTYQGESMMGKIIWFNKYDILLSLNTRIEVFLFRHAIFRFCRWSTLKKKLLERKQKRQSFPSKEKFNGPGKFSPQDRKPRSPSENEKPSSRPLKSSRPPFKKSDPVEAKSNKTP